MSGEPGARIQHNLLAGAERRLLDRLCAACPQAITPDHLTVLGLAGAGVVFTGYVASRFEPLFLLVAIAGYFLHWLGDSLDGSLARYRKAERPRYGYFVDHSVDAIGNFMIMAGLGMTHFVRMDVALFTIGGYLLLSIYVFLKKQVLNTFELSFIGLGPTELRIMLSVLTLSMLIIDGVGGISIGRQFFSVYDLLVLLAGSVFIVLFGWSVTTTARTLRDLGG